MAPASVFQQIFDYANRADPWRLYAELRKTPVAREADGTYVVSRYRDIVALLHDPRVSSDERNLSQAAESTEAAGRTPAAVGVDPPAGSAVRTAPPPRFISLDPPEHDRIRRILNRHYGPPEAPGRIDGMRPQLLEIVTSLIDGLTGKSQVDLVDDFAYPYPVMAICRLLGVPPEDEPRFRVWADAIVEGVGPRGIVPQERRARRDAAFAELADYLGTLADAHRQLPGEDLISALVTDDGALGHMSHAELCSNAALLLFAGHETTVNLITNGMLTLLRHPDILERVRREPEFVIRTVEELLRYEPPVHFLPQRVALADIDVAGTTIPAGAPIALALASGSRDPDHMTDPDRFDPDRIDPERFQLDHEGNQHLGFGGGIHYCFGAPLARQETQIALTELAQRLENPRLLADPPPYRPNALLRGPRHLPVGLDRVRPARAPGIPRARDASKEPATKRRR